VPFLRLTRDRRGFESTFLLHADHPGAKPRLLYWYRTAPGITLGRPPLDEDAIRTIEESHPDIEFDWPAILALSEVMTPEEEEAPPRAQQQSASARRPKKSRELRRDDRAEVSRRAAAEPTEPAEESVEVVEPDQPVEPVEAVESRGLVDDLAGREVARALRARYLEVRAKIDQIEGDRSSWLSRAEAINPDAWVTPEDVLDGVRNAGAAYETLKADLGYSSRE
jgi:hypothetical protein